MEVKIGDKWFTPLNSGRIAIKLNESERASVASMDRESQFLLGFDNRRYTQEQVADWVRDGGPAPVTLEEIERELYSGSWGRVMEMIKTFGAQQYEAGEKQAWSHANDNEDTTP